MYDKSVISAARLEQYADAEVAAKATLVGPHRDDVLFEKQRAGTSPEAAAGFVELSRYGSRGEQRLAVLWVKLAELSYIQSRLGDRPMLLLDDIFSELDEPHQQIVLDVVRHQQTIITSANPEIVELLERTQQHEIQVLQLPLEPAG